VPPLIGAQVGCGFRERCRYAHAECAAPVGLRAADAGHAYRCVQDKALSRRNDLRFVDA
jgi:peptide/nickel transport system ATP-binding protein